MCRGEDVKMYSADVFLRRTLRRRSREQTKTAWQAMKYECSTELPDRSTGETLHKNPQPETIATCKMWFDDAMQHTATCFQASQTILALDDLSFWAFATLKLDWQPASLIWNFVITRKPKIPSRNPPDWFFSPFPG